ncbi:MAG: hypothetical protein C0519_16430 [Hyphomicrobium sp.]|nr:hypothetical protein [Hyphomicrobium sp.]
MRVGAHRAATLKAVLVLMRRALALPVDLEDVATLTQACPNRLVKVASAHSVLNLIAAATEDADIKECLDPDLVAFLHEMRARNHTRNKALKTQLIEACRCLQQSGISVVALKGAVELTDPMYPHAADRFLSDLDVLVPAAQIDAAIAALEATGYSTRGAGFDRQSIHAPALWHESHPAAIELHTAVSWGRGNAMLPAATVFRQSIPSSESSFRIPALSDRLKHLVFHAQINSGRYRSHWFLLRDAADLHVLSQAVPPETWAEARACLGETDAASMFDGFLAAAARLLGTSPASGCVSSQGDAWAKKTLSRLMWPELHRWDALTGTSHYYLRRFISNPGLRRKYLRDVVQPATVKDFASRHLRTLRGYQ